MSGMKVVYDLSKPVGSRLVDVKVDCDSCTNEIWVDLQLGQTYAIAMPIYLATGGDDFTMFEQIQSEDLGVTDFEVVVRHIQANSPIDIGLEGRITLLNIPKLTLVGLHKCNDAFEIQ